MAHIIVIDDEEVLLGLISHTLRLDGHTIMETSDPLEALTIAGRPGQQLDLVITDVEMKPISGVELVKRLAQMGFKVPVLFMSGHPSVCGALASSLGDRHSIDKPFTASRLRQGVNALLAGKTARRGRNRVEEKADGRPRTADN